MKLYHLRNATTLLTLGEHRLLIDPMLCEAGAQPPLVVRGAERRRNPLVDLPPGTDDVLAQATDVLISHEHADHLDPPGATWIQERGLPVWASRVDVSNLRKKGLDVREIRDGSMGLTVEVVPGRHGRGVLGWALGPVSGFYLAHPEEPSVYLTGDTVLTSEVIEAIERLRPEVVVAPAGSANIGVGGDALFSVDELVALTKAAPGAVVFNHLEALDHCPTTREGLRRRMDAEGLGERVHIPDDGEVLSFERSQQATRPAQIKSDEREPGVQKWLSEKMFSGT